MKFLKEPRTTPPDSYYEESKMMPCYSCDGEGHILAEDDVECTVDPEGDVECTECHGTGYVER